jgi:dGTP triphosphohydrolase
MNLYELTDQIKAVADAIQAVMESGEDGAEIALENLNDALYATKSLFDEKVEAICYVIDQYNTVSEAQAAKAKALMEASKKNASKADRLKEYLLTNLRRLGIDKISTKTRQVSIRRNGGLEPIVWATPDGEPPEPTQLPKKYVKVVKTVQIDKEAVREALASGQELPFARLGERGESLVIR